MMTVGVSRALMSRALASGAVGTNLSQDTWGMMSGYGCSVASQTVAIVMQFNQRETTIPIIDRKNKDLIAK